MNSSEADYNDWYSKFHGTAQGLFAQIFWIGCLILLWPLLFLKNWDFDRLHELICKLADVFLFIVPIPFTPFIIVHELCHFLIVFLAIIHPKIKIEKWFEPEYLRPGEFSIGFRLQTPEMNEMKFLSRFLLILVSIAPFAGFLFFVYLSFQFQNAYIMAYFLLGSLFCVPSKLDRLNVAILLGTLPHYEKLDNQKQE